MTDYPVSDDAVHVAMRAAFREGSFCANPDQYDNQVDDQFDEWAQTPEFEHHVNTLRAGR